MEKLLCAARHVELFDSDHSDNEERFVAIRPVDTDMIVVIYTERDDDAAKDIPALRRFAGLTQEEFAEAFGISVHTLRNWEQGRRRPEGPAVALLRIAARRPSVLRENLAARA